MSYANIPAIFWYRIFVLAVKMAAQLDWLIVTNIDGEKKSKYEHFFGQKTCFLEVLRNFGEAGVITVTKQLKAKFMDQVVKSIMVGYCEEHSGVSKRESAPSDRGSTGVQKLGSAACRRVCRRGTATLPLRKRPALVTAGTKKATMAARVAAAGA